MAKKKKILIVTGDAGEGYECLYAKHRLQEAGYEPVIAAPSVKRLNLVIHDFEPGWDTYIEKAGYMVESDIAIRKAKEKDYEAILLLGGRAPEFLRNDAKLIKLVQSFDQQKKPILAICHGIQILVTAGLVRDKNITCYEHVKFEVEACGGTFVGKDEAVRDGRIVTGQTWQSHPEFYQLVFEILAESEKK